MQKDWKNLIFSLLDWIYKKKCYFCRRSHESVKMCSDCYDSLEFLNYGKHFAVEGVGIYCAGVYEKNLQKLIRGLKYHNQRDLAFYQAKFMYEYWHNVAPDGVFEVVPVPLHRERQAKRHYNHMELVAQEFCRLSGYVLNTKLISRVKNTKPQYKLSPAERAENLSGAFRVDKTAWGGAKILLLDDICTTGSTFAEMVKTLKNCGINDIICFATTTPKV